MSEDSIKWEYTFRNLPIVRDQPNWVEFYETEYDGKTVVLEVRHLGYPAPDRDIARLFIYYDSVKKNSFIGLQALVGVPNARTTVFLEPTENGHQAMDATKAPKLEDFVQQYKPLIESLRPLKETFQNYL